MNQHPLYQKLKETTGFIKSKVTESPQVGLILGSGLGSIAEEMDHPIMIPYSEIPHFHTTAVEGHAGRMLIGKISGISVALLQGRFHRYEGYSMDDIVFPTRTLCNLGIHTLLVTNAAGGINTRFRSGDLMLIEDHLNLTGDNPLVGPNPSQLGPRFPDMTEAYHRGCLEVLKQAAKTHEVPVHTGVYAGLLGPTYETPAEVRMLRTLGADAVGMSTVPETITANHFGIRVAGMSCITNLAAGLSSHKLTHQEVVDTSKTAVEKMKKIILTAIPGLAQKEQNSL